MDCIFCKIVAGEIPAHILCRDEELVAFHDINPQSPVHLLIVPVKHIETVLDLGEIDEALVGKMIRTASRLATDEGINHHGFRLVFNCGEYGGQEVYHLHLHVLGGRQMRWPPG
jgi:histidine triad (HIT) family protein